MRDYQAKRGDKICDGQQDCAHCPMGYKPVKDSVVCLEDRILEREEARIAVKALEHGQKLVQGTLAGGVCGDGTRMV